MGAVIHLGVGRGLPVALVTDSATVGGAPMKFPLQMAAPKAQKAAILTRALQQIGCGFNTPLLVTSVIILDNLSSSSLLL